MAYMIEGGGSKTWEKAKRWLFDYPEESKALLDRIANVCASFLVAQILAGAQLIQVFDSWAGELTPYDFRTFALPYLRNIAVDVKDNLALKSVEPPPMIVYARGAVNHSLVEISRLGYDVVGIDHTVEPAWARQCLAQAQSSNRKFSEVEVNKGAQHRIAIQGNFDPAILYARPEVIQDLSLIHI